MVVVHRSAWRMWALSLASIPVLLMAGDVLRSRWLWNKMVVKFYPGGRDLSPRDRMWGWMLLVVGIGLLVWSLIELLKATPVVKADKKSLELKLAGPYQARVSIPWSQVADLGAGVVDDDGTDLPVLWVRVTDPEILPSNPWGARFVAADTVALLASDWEVSADEVAGRLADLAGSGLRR